MEQLISQNSALACSQLLRIQEEMINTVTGGDVFKVERDNTGVVSTIYQTGFYTLSLDSGAQHDAFVNWRRLAPCMQFFKSQYCLGIPSGFVGYEVKSEDNLGSNGYLKILTPGSW